MLHNTDFIYLGTDISHVIFHSREYLEKGDLVLL